jgi:hypothetical protein
LNESYLGLADDPHIAVRQRLEDFRAELEKQAADTDRLITEMTEAYRRRESEAPKLIAQRDVLLKLLQPVHRDGGVVQTIDGEPPLPPVADIIREIIDRGSAQDGLLARIATSLKAMRDQSAYIAASSNQVEALLVKLPSVPRPQGRKES